MSGDDPEPTPAQDSDEASTPPPPPPPPPPAPDPSLESTEEKGLQSDAALRSEIQKARKPERRVDIDSEAKDD